MTGNWYSSSSVNLLWSDDLATGTLLSMAQVEIVKSERKSKPITETSPYEGYPRFPPNIY